MIPLICDIPAFSNAEYSRQKIEMTSCMTSFKSKDLCFAFKYDSFNFGEDLIVADFRRFIGTSVTSDASPEFKIQLYEQEESFNEEYDVSVRLPMTSITKKVKIRSISKFTPEIIL